MIGMRARSIGAYSPSMNATPVSACTLGGQYGAVCPRARRLFGGLDAAVCTKSSVSNMPQCAGMSLELFAPAAGGGYVSGAPCSSWRSYSSWS
jgi:hypothetical protein